MFNYFETYDDNVYNEADRTWRNEDGSRFYGFDNSDGTTDWYDSEGYLDSVTETPDDYEQAMNDSGIWFYD